jgi:RHS repeat-associated protein
MWRWGVSACALVAALGLAGTALAQSASITARPPTVPNIDSNGVDVTTGIYTGRQGSVSIGTPGQGGLSASIFSQGTLLPHEGAGTPQGYVQCFGPDQNLQTTCSVVFGGKTDVFYGQGGSQAQGLDALDGSTLGTVTVDQNQVRHVLYTLGDGTQVDFATPYYAGAPGQYTTYMLNSIASPDGHRSTYTYLPNGQCHAGGGCGSLSNIQSVASNTGANLIFYYTPDASVAGGQAVSQITAFNASFDSCPQGATSCNFAYAWPVVSYANSGASATATDSMQRSSSDNVVSSGGWPTETVTSAAGVTTTIAYAVSNPSVGVQVASVGTPAGTWRYSYSTSGSTLTTTVTDPNSNTKTYVSTSGLVTSSTDGLGRTTSYAYGSSVPGQVSQITYPEGNGVRYTYDGRGNITTTDRFPFPGANQADIITTAGYDPGCTYAVWCNKPEWTKDANGNETDYSYDNSTGVLLSATKPAGANGVRPQIRFSYAWQSASYYSAGSWIAGPAIYLLTSVSSCNTQQSCTGTADETRVSISYDASHYLLPQTVTTSSGENPPSVSATNSTGYDIFGNATSKVDALGNVTSLRYDTDRELVGVISPDPDGGGPLTPVAHRISYDPDGRVIAVEAGSVNSASDTDWTNFTSQIRYATLYDSIGRKVGSLVQPTGGAATNYIQYGYDGANRLICKITRMNIAIFAANYANEPGPCVLGQTGGDGPDRLTNYQYDAADEVTSVSSGLYTPTQHTDMAVLQYTLNGMPYRVQDANGNVTTFWRDGFDRSSQTNYPSPSSAGSSSTSDYVNYAYDPNGNLTVMRLRDGTMRNFSYDALGNLLNDGVHNFAYDNMGRITVANSSPWTLSQTYDALGRVTNQSNDYGGSLTSSYDANGRRIRLTWGDGFFVTYAYDAVGHVTTISENGATSGPGVLASYNFDALGREGGVSYGSGLITHSFAYDGVSRVVAWSHATWGDQSKNVVENVGYNGANQINVRSITSDIYEWGGYNNGSQGYAIDGLNRIASASPYTFAYDGKGNLTSDGLNSYGYTVDNKLNSANSNAFWYDGLNRLVQTNGSASTRFTYDGSTIAEERDGNTNALLRRYVPGPDGQPLVWYEGTGTSDRRWLLKDQAGSVVAVGSSSGTALAINTYDDFGVPGPSNIGRFGFAGRPWIPEAGLYDNMARSYSPTLGRFMQTDLIGYGDGMNWYNYAHGDPVNGSDPSGLDTVLSEGTISAPRIPQPTVSTPSPLDLFTDDGPPMIDIASQGFTKSLPPPPPSSFIKGVIVVAKRLAKPLASVLRWGDLPLDIVQFWSYDSGLHEVCDTISCIKQLTPLGRALMKHGNRLGSAFPRPTGNAKQINDLAAKIVNEILENGTSEIRSNGRFGTVNDITDASGRGVRYDQNGNFIGFLEP